MLEDFCSTLTDEAQLKIALRLCGAALPVWLDSFASNAAQSEQLNALYAGGKQVGGAEARIDADFPRRALDEIERCYRVATERGSGPVEALKTSQRLAPLLATAMRPLTNPAWDAALPHPVRLVFTSVWNILTWLLFRRKAYSGETHIYVAINQAADAILSEYAADVRAGGNGPSSVQAGEHAESAGAVAAAEGAGERALRQVAAGWGPGSPRWM